MAPTGSAASVAARTWPTARRPRECRSKTSAAVSNSERRSSRLDLGQGLAGRGQGQDLLLDGVRPRRRRTARP